METGASDSEAEGNEAKAAGRVFPVKFAVMMHTNPTHSKALSEEDVSAIEAKHAKLLEELEAAGELINGAGLHLPEETTTIRIVAGRPVSSTGPVAAGDEHVTAYYLLECPDRDRAVEIASRILDSHVTAVEVRQVHNSTGLD
jgi:hypothetical protein